MLTIIFSKNNNNNNNNNFFTIIVLQFCLIIFNLNFVLNNEIIYKRKPYEEFFMDHQVTEKDAKVSFNNMQGKLLKSNKPEWCRNCSVDDIKYCLSSRLLRDHCCCDQRHGDDQLSWIPHTCYVGAVGATPCRPNIGSCVTYTEIKACCCDLILAEDWKFVYYSDTSSISQRKQIYFVFLIVPLLVHVLT